MTRKERDLLKGTGREGMIPFLPGGGGGGGGGPPAGPPGGGGGGGGPPPAAVRGEVGADTFCFGSGFFIMVWTSFLKLGPILVSIYSSKITQKYNVSFKAII